MAPAPYVGSWPGLRPWFYSTDVPLEPSLQALASGQHLPAVKPGWGCPPSARLALRKLAHYSAETIQSAARAGYTHAATVRARLVRASTGPHEIPTFALEPHCGIGGNALLRIKGRLDRVRQGQSLLGVQQPDDSRRLRVQWCHGRCPTWQACELWPAVGARGEYRGRRGPRTRRAGPHAPRRSRAGDPAT
jgi:hypothetical protein